MSDFVTELRREVVAAHAQHRVAAVRTRRRRRRPVLAGAVALAALLVAVALVVRSIPRPEQTAEPRVVKVLHIGGNPTDGVLAAGSLWVAEFEHSQVVRIDPRTRKVIARIPVGDGSESIAGDDKGIWVRADRLWRIDPRTNRATTPRAGPTGPEIAVSDGDAWVNNRNYISGESVDRISPAGEIVRRIPLQLPAELAVSGPRLWVSDDDGTIVRIDERSGQIEHRWPRLAPGGGNEASTTLLADPRGAWVLSPATGQIIRLDGNRVVRVLQIDDSVRPNMTRAADGLWVVTSDDPRHSAIERIDPRSGKVTATVQLGSHYPRALVPAPGGLWVVAGDGTVVLVAG
jgi:streptogramin lyase